MAAESDLALHTDKEACGLAEDSELSLYVAGEPHGDRKGAMPNRPSGRWIRASTPRTVPPVLCLRIGIDMMGMSAGGGLRRAVLRQRRRRVRLPGGGFVVEWSGCSSDMRDCGASGCFIHEDLVNVRTTAIGECHRTPRDIAVRACACLPGKSAYAGA